MLKYSRERYKALQNRFVVRSLTGKIAILKFTLYLDHLEIFYQKYQLSFEIRLQNCDIWPIQFWLEEWKIPYFLLCCFIFVLAIFSSIHLLAATKFLHKNRV